MRDCKIVSRKFEIQNSHRLEVAKVHDAYRTLEKMKEYSSVQIIEIIKDRLRIFFIVSVFSLIYKF